MQLHKELKKIFTQYWFWAASMAASIPIRARKTRERRKSTTQDWFPSTSEPLVSVTTSSSPRNPATLPVGAQLNIQIYFPATKVVPCANRWPAAPWILAKHKKEPISKNKYIYFLMHLYILHISIFNVYLLHTCIFNAYIYIYILKSLQPPGRTGFSWPSSRAAARQELGKDRGQKKPFKTGKFHRFPRLQMSKPSFNAACCLLPIPCGGQAVQALLSYHKKVTVIHLTAPWTSLGAKFIRKSKILTAPIKY